MASGNKGLLAERYAAALYELAEEQGVLDRVASDLRRLNKMLAESPDLRRLCASPVIGSADKQHAITALAQRAEFAPLTINFLGLIAHNGRLFALEPVLRAFLTLLADKRGEVIARVASAAPLGEPQLAAVSAALKRAMGHAIALETAIDPSLLGGLVVQVGSRMIDGSLKTKLQRLSLAMKGTG